MKTDLQARPEINAMAAEHDDHKAAYDDINVRSIALIVGVGAILLFVAIVSVQVIYYRYSQNEFVEKVERAPTVTVNEYLDAQRKRLTVAGPGAAEGEKSISIDQAMKDVVAEYQRKQSAEKNAAVESNASADAATADVSTEAKPTEK
jgi:hypothetical protein